MKKQLFILPIKILNIFNNNLNIGRLKSQLNFFKYCFKVKIEYTEIVKLTYFKKRNKRNFYKFTGTKKTCVNYKQYEILNSYKYLIYKLKNKNININSYH